MATKIVLVVAFAAALFGMVINGRGLPATEMSGGEVDKAFLHLYFPPYHHHHHHGVFGGYRGGGVVAGFGGGGFGGRHGNGNDNGNDNGGDDGGIAGTGGVGDLESGATTIDDAFGDDLQP